MPPDMGILCNAWSIVWMCLVAAYNLLCCSNTGLGDADGLPKHVLLAFWVSNIIGKRKFDDSKSIAISSQMFVVHGLAGREREDRCQPRLRLIRLYKSTHRNDRSLHQRIVYGCAVLRDCGGGIFFYSTNE